MALAIPAEQQGMRVGEQNFIWREAFLTYSDGIILKQFAKLFSLY